MILLSCLMDLHFPIHESFLDILGEEEIALLASIVKFRRAERNDLLIHTGKPVKDIFYIHKGLVRLYMPDESGREINTHFAWDGMFITSYYSLINNKLSDEAVVAITDCELYHFSYHQLAALFDPYPKVERLGRILAEQAFCCLAERGRMLQTMTAKERYLHLLKTIPTEVFQNIPMQDIASYLGIAPGSLSRIRNEFLHIC